MGSDEVLMKVIGAGYGRTGTSSLKRALEQLGFGPCHHMEELFKNPNQIPAWVAVAERKPADWDTMFHGYEAAVDFPSQYFYKELSEHWPDSKIILSVRDAESWWQSARQTIYAISQDWPIRWVGPYLPVAGGVTRMANRLIWNKEMDGRFLEKEYAKQVFLNHIEEVKRTIPAERLLVWEAKEGWEPLCKFLNVPVPTEPFPRVNDTAEFRMRVRALRAVSIFVLLLPFFGVGALLFLSK